MGAATTSVPVPDALATPLPATPRRAWRTRIGIDAMTPAWAALAAASADDNVFFNPAFLGPASQGLGASIDVIAITSGSGLIDAMLPLRDARLGRIAPVVEGWGHDYGPLGVPLVARAGLPGAARDLFEAAIESAGPGRGLVLPFLPDDSPVTAAFLAAARMLGRRVDGINSHARAMLERSSGIDPRAMLSTRRRKEYGRQMRRLRDVGAVTIEIVATPGEIGRRFDEFLRLEAAGWKGRRGTALRDQPRICRFARQATEALAAEDACRIVSLRVDDRPAAMVLCFLSGGTAFTWKIAYDEALARFSPGAQLMLEAPPLLFADPRVQRIDSCATPNHPMIDHLWRGRLALTTLVIEPDRQRLRHRLGLASHHAERRLRAFLASRRRKPATQSQEPTP